jgi:predicted component of type VI protein secretion system
MSRCGVVARVCAALTLAGCGASSKPVHAARPAPFHLEITAGKDVNQGGPLYVVIRKIDSAGFLAEDYDAIADGLFREPHDPAVLRKAIVRPGQVVIVDADHDLAEGEITGIYFLFSMPGDDWRLAIQDRAIHRVSIVLGASGVTSVEQRP